MAYCIKNKSKEPVNVIGLVIAPGKVSRQLSDDEVKLAWSSSFPDGVSLVPLLMEAAASPSLSEASPPSVEQEAPSLTKRRRLKE